MKKQVEIEIEDEDIQYSLQCAIENMVKNRAMQLIKDKIDEMVSSKINSIIEKIVIDEVKNGKFRVSGFINKTYPTDSYEYDLIDIIKKEVRQLLSDKTYIFDRDATYPSKFTSSGDRGSNTSLIELIVADMIRKQVNDEYLPEIENCIKEYVLNIENTSKVIEHSVKEVFNKKIKNAYNSIL